jgi:hypothetical protein
MRVAAIAALCVILSACSLLGGSSSTPSGNAAATDSPAAVSAARITPPPVTPPTAPGTNLPAFACANASGGAAGTASVTGVRVGEQVGYDRFVIEFTSSVPAYTVTRQASPTFTNSPSGQRVTLSGTAGALVIVHNATGAGTYIGSNDLQHSEFDVIKEARQTEDFEGTLQWALGLSRPACMRTFTLANPPRLVVDFTTAS